MRQQTAINVPVLLINLFMMRLKMVLQIGRVLSLQHHSTVLTIHHSHLTDTHVGVGQVLEVFPDRAGAPPAHIL